MDAAQRECGRSTLNLDGKEEPISRSSVDPCAYPPPLRSWGTQRRSAIAPLSGAVGRAVAEHGLLSLAEPAGGALMPHGQRAITLRQAELPLLTRCVCTFEVVSRVGASNLHLARPAGRARSVTRIRSGTVHSAWLQLCRPRPFAALSTLLR